MKSTLALKPTVQDSQHVLGYLAAWNNQLRFINVLMTSMCLSVNIEIYFYLKTTMSVTNHLKRYARINDTFN